jgi:dTDP-4-dehydrorhamnose 3,5-epimerase
MKKLNLHQLQKGIIFKNVEKFGDDRGDFINISLELENSLKTKFKRSYIINNNGAGVVRAFHGHKNEGKLFYVPKGAFKFIVMDLDLKKYKEYNLLESVPKILYVPGGYYNGFVSLKENSLLVAHATSNMEDSLRDDYRLPFDYLGKEAWLINNR